MRIVKRVGILLVSLLLTLIFLIPKAIVIAIRVIESILSIIKNTMEFLMKQIKEEVLK